MHDKETNDAQAARARFLREQINAITSGAVPSIVPGSPQQPGESDRDFVERRSKEDALDKKDRN